MTTWTQSMDGTLPVVKFEGENFWEDELEEKAPSAISKLVFQHGPIGEVGVNGTTIEAVIRALINRLEGFQRGPFKNEYNADALKHLLLAKDALEARTRDRQERGVEGTNRE